MKTTSILLLTATILATTVRLHAQVQSPSPAAVAPVAFEPLPTLDASVILQPQYFHGPNLPCENPCPLTSARTATRSPPTLEFLKTMATRCSCAASRKS